MPYLSDEELTTIYYPRAAAMGVDIRMLYLQRANAVAWGYIGGMPTYSVALPPEPLKAAVALAYEIMSKYETGADVNPVNGNITEEAPAGFFARTVKPDPLETVYNMLRPYRDAFIDQNASQSDRGMRFLP